MRPVLAVALAAGLVTGGAGMAVASTDPSLAAHGPTSVSGTEASAVFRVGGRTVRQVRYADRETLVYSFALENEGRLPVTVRGLAPLERTPRLFGYVELTDAEGREEFTIPAGGRTTVAVGMLMHSCETLSARAGSFATEMSLRTERAGMIDDVVTVTFPEEVHTGSPREAFCPKATATSRPPG
ncbi:MAG TPA: hypothetical protein VFR87_12250 [Nocardioidaceae bacterium]|nr:hypothetical protein [Nocardioidaceae bacterium]